MHKLFTPSSTATRLDETASAPWSWKRLPGLAAAATVVIGSLIGNPALAALPISGDVTEYPMPYLLASPCEEEFDQEAGYLWIEAVTGNAIVRFNTVSGQFTNFRLPNPAGIPGGMDRGPDNGIWFTEMVGNAIVRLDPADGSMQTFPIPWANALAGVTGFAVSDDIESGADGAMWFTMIGINAIGRIDVNTKQMTKYQIPTPLAATVIIKRGPNNTMVFPEYAGNKVGTINVYTKQITEYPVPTPVAGPQGATTGPDGAIWFTESLGQNLGRIDPNTGAVTELSLLALRSYGLVGGLLGGATTTPLPSPGPILTGSDGRLYFIEGGPPFGPPDVGNMIGRYDLSTHQLQEFTTPTLASGPCDLNAEQPGEIWFGEFTANKEGRLTIVP